MSHAARTIVDYHIHTKASSDGKGTMEEYACKAQEKQIAEIGFSDHIDGDRLTERSDIFSAKMSKYVEAFLNCRKASSVRLKLGCEVDYFLGEIKKTEKILEEYPFDYVIGSVHFVGDWGIDNPAKMNEHSKKNPLESYEGYFRYVREMCRTRLFDIVGHPDLIKIFGLKPINDVSQIYTDTAQTIADSHMCAEINAKGLERPCKEMYPSLEFLQILHKNSVPITFGSDAHNPADLGLNLSRAVRLAKKAGYAEACLFERREKTSYPI
jgi:histidinol-phosphatase (PHP family)